MCCMKTAAARSRGLRRGWSAWQVVQFCMRATPAVRATKRWLWLWSEAEPYPMKKNFPLKVPDKADARVLESVKNELRKYVQREQRKKLPEGFTRWDFACKVGVDATSAAVKLLSEVVDSVDAAAKAGGASVYVEIVAVPGRKFEPDAPSAL